jgi:16S rRNA pseudouridine516 synthase
MIQQRLDNFLIQNNLCSKRSAKNFVLKNKVCINGETEKNYKANINPQQDEIFVNEKKIETQKHIYLVMNKPSGYICSSKDELYPSILNLLEEKYRRLNLLIVGRLDVDTEGLILLTTNGGLVHDITSPSERISKTYYVKTEKKIIDEKRLEYPLELIDGKGNKYTTDGGKVAKLSDFELLLTIEEGKFHQVKKC